MLRLAASDVRCGVFILLVLSLLFSLGCAGNQRQYPLHPSLQSDQLPPPLTVKELFDNDAEKYRFRVSPDGKRLAWVATVRGTTTVHHKTIGEERVRHISARRGNIYGFRWAQDSQRILVNYRRRGKENNDIYTLNLDEIANAPFKLYEFKGFMSNKKRALIHRLMPADPDHILIVNNDRDLSCYDLYKVSIHAKDRQLLATNPGDVRKWITDRQGRLRGRVRLDEARGIKVLEFPGAAEGDWRKIFEMPFEDVFHVVGFDDQAGDLWALSSRHRDKVALVRFDPDTQRETVVFANPKVDLDGYEVVRATRVPFMVYAVPDYPEVTFLDPQIEKDFAPLLARIEADGLHSFNITSLDNQARVFTIYAYSDRDWCYYLFDRVSGTIEHLSHSPLHARRAELAAIQPVAFESRDGITINGYLTLPPGIEAQRLPMVVLVHGGPWSRDYWGFKRHVQFYANRGYAVLQINFRGSDGYGKDFMELAVGEFAGTMQNDLIDGARWAIREGIADPAKIAISGQSYGGYATLVGLTFTPDFFACGINVFGPSELETLVEHAPVWWKLGLPKFHKYIGDPDKPEDRARMRAKSPLYRLGDLNKPLLVIYGSEDQRVAKKQSKDIIARLTELEKKFEWHAFPDAGHGIYGKNRVTYYNLVEEFLAKHLGGRQS